MISDKLSNIAWGQLSHAHGNAADVPHMLCELAGNNRKQARRALCQLYETIFHQGTIYSATAPAVPFIWTIVDSPGAINRADLLSLLFTLTCGDELGWRVIAQSAAKGPQEEPHMPLLLATRQAVLQGLLARPHLLHSDDRATRIGAIRVASTFAEAAESLVPLVAALLDTEDDIRVRIAIVLALGELGQEAEVASPTLEASLQPLLNDATPSLRTAAAIALSWSAQNPAQPALTQESRARVTAILTQGLGRKLADLSKVKWAGCGGAELVSLAACHDPDVMTAALSSSNAAAKAAGVRMAASAMWRSRQFRLRHVAQIADLMADPSPTVRVAAADCVCLSAGQANERHRDAIVQALEAAWPLVERDETRWTNVPDFKDPIRIVGAALHALGRLGDERCVDILAQVIETGMIHLQWPTVLAGASLAMHDWIFVRPITAKGMTKHIDALKPAIMRRLQLGSLGRPVFTPPLVDTSLPELLAGVEAWGFGAADLAPVLLPRLDDPDEFQRAYVAQALGRILPREHPLVTDVVAALEEGLASEQEAFAQILFSIAYFAFTGDPQPALSTFCRDDCFVGGKIHIAVALGLAAREMGRFLRELIHTTDYEAVALEAAFALFRVEQDPTPFVTQLLSILPKPDDGSYRRLMSKIFDKRSTLNIPAHFGDIALMAGEIGEPANAVVPYLQAIVELDEYMYRCVDGTEDLQAEIAAVLRRFAG